MTNADQNRMLVFNELKLADNLEEDKYFHDIVTLAAFTCKSPMGFFSVFNDNHQYLKAAFGFIPRGGDNFVIHKEDFVCEKEDSFCNFTLHRGRYEPLIIEDTHKSDLVRENKFVTGEPFLRFYAGFPVRYAGVNLGALCVADVQPRKCSPSEIASMYILREQLEGLLIKRELLFKSKKPWWKLF